MRYGRKSVFIDWPHNMSALLHSFRKLPRVVFLSPPPPSLSFCASNNFLPRYYTVRYSNHFAHCRPMWFFLHLIRAKIDFCHFALFAFSCQTTKAAKRTTDWERPWARHADYTRLNGWRLLLSDALAFGLIIDTNSWHKLFQQMQIHSRQCWSVDAQLFFLFFFKK